ncbi:N-acetyltransferase [Furfurilactobacillus sp. WILCCON 0119]|uniref:N-acetyltransferase n=1 Tax=Furfurilactobacillus entadae TaxID=2922307 RepID=UPI0035E6136B
MLVKYRDDYEKTTMGLLAFLPDFRNMDHLKTEMRWYTEVSARQMYLWRNDHQQFTGVLGVELTGDVVLVRLLVLSPQERNDSTRNAILDAVAKLYPERRIMGTIEMTPTILRWQNLDGR